MHGFDYAAAWFNSDMIAEFPEYPYPLFPCEKDLKNKEKKLSFIKDIMIGTKEGSLLTISDRAVNFYKEAEEYIPEYIEYMYDQCKTLHNGFYVLDEDLKPTCKVIDFVVDM